LSKGIATVSTQLSNNKVCWGVGGGIEKEDKTKVGNGLKMHAWIDNIDS
jgi:hypothetical protein